MCYEKGANLTELAHLKQRKISDLVAEMAKMLPFQAFIKTAIKIVNLVLDGEGRGNSVAYKDKTPAVPGKNIRVVLGVTPHFHIELKRDE